jgi:signal transduction histidine kinase
VGDRGEPDLSQALTVTLYRVAQEAITNAMKHAPGQPVSIAFEAKDRRIELVISNSITSGPSRPPGRGRRGMAERVALLGGSLETGQHGDTFVVHATLDIRAGG